MGIDVCLKNGGDHPVKQHPCGDAEQEAACTGAGASQREPSAARARFPGRALALAAEWNSACAHGKAKEGSLVSGNHFHCKGEHASRAVLSAAALRDAGRRGLSGTCRLPAPGKRGGGGGTDGASEQRGCDAPGHAGTSSPRPGPSASPRPEHRHGAWHFSFLVCQLSLPQLRTVCRRCPRARRCLWIQTTKATRGGVHGHVSRQVPSPWVRTVISCRPFALQQNHSAQSSEWRQIFNNSAPSSDLLWACNASGLHFFVIAGKTATWQTSGSGYTPSDLQGSV